MPALAGMTAFARRSVPLDDGEVTWEVKSVNGKGLDLRLRTPPGFEGEEAGFRAHIAAVVTRGSLQAVLSVSRVAAPPRIRVDPVVLRGLIVALAEAMPPGASIGPATLDGLLAVRGVVEIDETPGDTVRKPAVVAAQALLDATLDDLRAMRAGEGSALGGLLHGHLDGIDTRIAAAEAAPGRTPQAVRARLERTVRGLFDAVPALDPNRLHQEAIIMATRADVQEELDRLRIHSAGARALLAGGGSVGRRLDFLAQELAREASTLCAKSNDADLTAIGLELRAQIEQFREQVQNLE